MKRGKKYVEAAKAVDRATLYDAPEAISLVKKAAVAKFDETIEVHIRTGCDGRHADQQIRGAVVLPHGTGKKVRVLVFANDAKADYFVSIHRNSSPTPNQYTGVETLVYNNSGIKSQMAANINSELEKAGFKNLGITERPNLVVLKRTKMPAVLVEASFINNDKDNETFDKNFNQIANGIADGILKTLGIKPKTNNTTAQAA